MTAHHFPPQRFTVRIRILPSLAPDKTREAACQAGTRQAMWVGGHPNSRQGPPSEIRQACAPRVDPWIWMDAGHDEGLASEAMPYPYVILETDLAFRCCVLDKQLHTAYQKGANSNESQRPVQSAPPSPSTMYVQVHVTPSKAPGKKNVKLQICARSTPMARSHVHSGHAACEALAKHNACTALVKPQNHPNYEHME